MIPADPRRGRGMMAAAVALALCAGSATGAAAQWQVEASAGGVTHEATGGAVSSSSAILGVRHEGPIWAYLSSGLPLGAEGVPWAASGLGGRLDGSYRAFGLGVDLGAQAHGYRVPDAGDLGGGLVLDALPFVALDLRGTRLEARSGITHYSSTFAGETISRTLHESGLTAEIRPHRAVGISADGTVLRAEEGDYTAIGVAADVALPRGALWAQASRWSSDLLPDPSWGAGAILRIARDYALRASYQQEATDPLFWNETRRFWSVGLSRQLGRPAQARLVAPVLPRMTEAGVVFRIPADANDAPPSVAGDFNGWTPVEMRRDGNEWVVVIPVSPGVHRYAFRAADGEWFVPETVENRVDDGFGGTNAVLVVPPADAS